MKVEIPFVSCLLLVILQINIAFARLRAADESTGILKLSEDKFYLDPPTFPQTLPDEKGFKLPDTVLDGPFVKGSAAFEKGAFESGLHMFTQYFLEDIRRNKTVSTGFIESGRDHYDMRLNFSLGLHSSLAPMDDFDVLHFEPGGENFRVKEPHERLRVGATLLGSLLGKWAKHEHSAAAMHSEENGAHKSGGLAYIRRVSALTELEDGSIRVQTSRDLQGLNPFHKGSFAVDWNNTQVKRRRRTDEEAWQAYRAAKGFNAEDLSDLNTEARRLNQGVCDSQCDEYYHSSSWEYDRLGGETCASTYWSYCSTGGGTTSDPYPDDDNEFCYYCFEYEKTVSAFEFNYDGSGGAQTSTLYPLGSSYPEVTCTDCFAYVGATAFVVVDWDTSAWSIDVLKGGVTGTAAFNFDFKVSTITRSFSSQIDLVTIDNCVPTITLYSIATISSKCVLSSTVSGSATLDGEIHATAAFEASKTIGAQYTSSGWESISSSTWNWSPPSLTYDINGGTLAADFTLKPAVELTLTIGYSGIISVSATDTISILPKTNFEISLGTRRLSESTDSELVAGSTIALGHSILAELKVDETIEQVSFRMSSECWDGVWLWLQDSRDVAPESPPVEIPIPHHVLLTGTPCDKYYIEAFEAHHVEHAIRSVPFSIPGLLPTDGDACQPSLVVSPSDGEVIDVLAPYEFHWNADEIFWFQSSSMIHEGSVRSASFVRIDLVGSAEPDGEGKCAFGKLNEERGTCIEKVRLTPEAGAPNIGSFTFNFSLNVDGFGNPLYFGESWDPTRYTNGVRISISAREHTYTGSLSRGLFFLGGAAEDTRSPRCPEALEVATLSTAVPLVSVNTGSTENRRRLSTGMLSSDYNMDVENDFGAVTLNTVLTGDTEIFSDSSAADMSASVLDSTSIVDGVQVYDASDTLTPTQLPTTYGSRNATSSAMGDTEDATTPTPTNNAASVPLQSLFFLPPFFCLFLVFVGGF